MKTYQCHKKVKAAKIKKITFAPPVNLYRCDLEGCTQGRMLDQEYMDQHSPIEGGYYVQYADGYESYSPAKAFEEGYTECT